MKTTTMLALLAALVAPCQLQANEKPQLPLQENRIIAEFTTLMVTNTAMDTDLTDTLTYILVDPPAGICNIDENNVLTDTNGIILWRPGEAQGGGTHVFTTIVTDDGLPPLSDTNTFTVEVSEVPNGPRQPQIRSLTRNGTLIWTAPYPGTNTLEFCTNLNNNEWTTQLSNIPITNWWNTNSLPMPGQQGFYRVMATSSGGTDDFSAEYVATLCEHTNYKGNGITLRVFNPPNSTDYWFELSYPGLSGHNWQNCISSFESLHAWWEVYDDTCAEDLLDEGTGNNSNCANSGYNDKISSIRVAYQDGWDWGALTVFVNAGSNGERIQFKIYRQPRTDNHVVFEIQLLDPYWNDLVSSIETESQGNTRSHTWYFYENDNYSGGSMSLANDADDADLKDNDFNDKISSLRLVIDN